MLMHIFMHMYINLALLTQEWVDGHHPGVLGAKYYMLSKVLKYKYQL